MPLNLNENNVGYIECGNQCCKHFTECNVSMKNLSKLNLTGFFIPKLTTHIDDISCNRGVTKRKIVIDCKSYKNCIKE